MSRVSAREFLRFFFQASGRISRAEYALGLGFIYAAVSAILLWTFGQSQAMAAVAFAAISVPAATASLVLAAKRCHDLSLPGSFILLLVVPIAGLVWLVALALLPGKAGPNLYGAPPRFRRD